MASIWSDRAMHQSSRKRSIGTYDNHTVSISLQYADSSTHHDSRSRIRDRNESFLSSGCPKTVDCAGSTKDFSEERDVILHPLNLYCTFVASKQVSWQQSLVLPVWTAVSQSFTGVQVCIHTLPAPRLNSWETLAWSLLDRDHSIFDDSRSSHFKEFAPDSISSCTISFTILDSYTRSRFSIVKQIQNQEHTNW